MTFYVFFFFNDTATTEIYTLSLHDALPILWCARAPAPGAGPADRRVAAHAGNVALCTGRARPWTGTGSASSRYRRSEEHTSELQSRQYLVCRLLLEKKKTITQYIPLTILPL